MSAGNVTMQQDAESSGRPRPWYREPMVWLVITIPAAAVVGGLSTVVIAHRHSDVVVADDYRREGLAIQRDPTRDRAAARLGVGAEVAIADGTLSVRLDPGRAAAPGTLVVLLSHGTRADLDRLVMLRPIGEQRYAAPIGTLAAGHWYLEVSPADRAWRLTGEFTDRPGALTLRPAARP